MQDFVIGYKLLQLGDGKDTASINDSNDLNKSVSSHLFEYIKPEACLTEYRFRLKTCKRGFQWGDEFTLKG